MMKTKKIPGIYLFLIGLLVGFMTMFAIDFLGEKGKQKEENMEVLPSNPNAILKTEDTPQTQVKEKKDEVVKISKDTNQTKTETKEENIEVEITQKIEEVPINEINMNSDEVSIAKDEFLGSRKITAKKISETDSSSVEFFVEFWQSPVNYRGYKRNDKRIVVFGFDVDTEINLVFMRDSLWLEYKNKRFLLKKSQDFNRFIPTKE